MKNFFSFKGRIRRSDYIISIVIFYLFQFVLNKLYERYNSNYILIAYIPLIWFILAQGTKRCHDRGNSGWYQIIPFYELWMLLGDSDIDNKYGNYPKKRHF